MKSTQDFPFAFFDYYFNIRIYEDLEKFYEDYTGYGGVKYIDRENHVFTYHSKRSIDYYHKRESFSFKEYLCEFYKKEIIISNLFVDQKFQLIFSDKIEVIAYHEFLKRKLSIFKNLRAYHEFDFVKDIVGDLEKHINIYASVDDVTQVNSSNVFSFNLLAADADNQINIIERLYQSVTNEPRLVAATYEEFENAFSGKEVKNGINWLATGKNKLTSKVSLFYFIDELINKGFLARSLLNNLNRHVGYVFRDNQGNEFKNLKQSKSTYSNNVAFKEAIDEIISSL